MEEFLNFIAGLIFVATLACFFTWAGVSSHYTNKYETKIFQELVEKHNCKVSNNYPDVCVMPNGEIVKKNE